MKLKLFQLASKASSQTADEYLNRGFVKSILGDKKGAINDYNRAIEINPKYAKAYFKRGIAKFDLADIDSACSDWKKAAELGHSKANELIKQYCK